MPDLLYEKKDHYAIFTMNRPDRLNALGGTMQEELNEAMQDFTADVEMRVGIITGSGDRAFSAGADLKEMASSDQPATDGARQVSESVSEAPLLSGTVQTQLVGPPSRNECLSATPEPRVKDVS